MCSLLLPAATKPVGVGTHRGVLRFAHTVLLHFLKESRITLQALHLEWSKPTLESEIVLTVQLYKPLHAFRASVLQTTLLSVFGFSFIKSRGSLCTNMFTLIHLAHFPEYKPDSNTTFLC